MVTNDAESLIRKSESFDQHYDVLHELGRGRFAVVKKCVCKKTGKQFAAKIIKKSRTSSQGRSGREQLLLEIDILNNSNHPKLVRLYDVFETRSEMQLILELAAGGDLHRHCIEADVTRTEKEICYLIRQITEAVRYLHDQSIVHLDLKPDNILLAKEGEVFPEIRLIDFGLSRRLDVPYSQFDIVGTAEYVAPEVLAFEPLDYGSDMWSIGVVTYVLLSGISPFAGDDVMETYANIGMVDYDFDCEEFDEISDTAIDFIEKLLERAPKKRMTAREALEHDWLKQLDGGITAVDVAYAKQAQQEPLPDNEISPPLVEDDYVSSSESETPLEKSMEVLNDSRTGRYKRAEVVDSIGSIEEVAEDVIDEAVEESRKGGDKEVPKEVPKEVEDVPKRNEDLPKEKETVVPEVKQEKVSKETDEDKPKKNEKAPSNIIDKYSSKESSFEKKNIEKNIEKKTKGEIEVSNKDTPPKKENNKTSVKEVEKDEPSKNTDKDVVKKDTDSKSIEPKSVGIVEEKDSDAKQDKAKEPTPSKSTPQKSTAPEENSKVDNKLPKRNSDCGMPNRPSAIEQRKLALQMKMKDESGKNSKPKSVPTTPTRNSRASSNKSSANSSPGEVRKFENQSPVPRRTESPISATQKKPSTQSPQLNRKADRFAKFSAEKPKATTPEPRKIPGKVAGGFASKMAKFSNPEETSPKQRTTPPSFQRYERKSSKEIKTSANKDEPVQTEAKTQATAEPAKKENKAQATDESLKTEIKTLPVEKPVEKEIKTSPVEEPVDNGIKTSPVEEPVEKEKKTSPVKKPVKTESKTSPIDEPVSKENKASPVSDDPVKIETQPIRKETVEKKNKTTPLKKDSIQIETSPIPKETVENKNRTTPLKKDSTQNKKDNVEVQVTPVSEKDKIEQEVSQPKTTPVKNNVPTIGSPGNSLKLTPGTPNKMVFGKPKVVNSAEKETLSSKETPNSKKSKDTTVENKPEANESLKVSEQKPQDIKFSLSLGGSLSPSGRKLNIGQLKSVGAVEEPTNTVDGTEEVDGNKPQHPMRVKLGTGGTVKLGIGRPNRKSEDETIDPSKRGPMLKDIKGKSGSTSQSRRRAGTGDTSPNSPRKNYRRLYVTKVRNSKVFSNDVTIDSEAAAEIMQRVDNDVLKVEFRLKSTDLKLLPQ